MNIDIQFFPHIFPQIISLIILSFAFFKGYKFFYQSEHNHYNIGNLALAILLLLYGKIAVFILHQDIEILKFQIDVSLMAYFAIMPITLVRLTSNIHKKWQIWLQIMIIPFLAGMLDTSFNQSLIIFFADIYLVVILLFSTLKCKAWLIGSFLFLGTINLLNGYYVDFLMYYAWLEIVGQILFTKGLLVLLKEEK
jgi:hypothetical protein